MKVLSSVGLAWLLVGALASGATNEATPPLRQAVVNLLADSQLDSAAQQQAITVIDAAEASPYSAYRYDTLPARVRPVFLKSLTRWTASFPRERFDTPLQRQWAMAELLANTQAIFFVPRDGVDQSQAVTKQAKQIYAELLGAMRQRLTELHGEKPVDPDLIRRVENTFTDVKHGPLAQLAPLTDDHLRSLQARLATNVGELTLEKVALHREHMDTQRGLPPGYSVIGDCFFSHEIWNLRGMIWEEFEAAVPEEARKSFEAARSRIEQPSNNLVKLALAERREIERRRRAQAIEPQR